MKIFYFLIHLFPNNPNDIIVTVNDLMTNVGVVDCNLNTLLGPV